MKTHLQFGIFTLLLASLSVKAQVITNTYSTGFDSAAEKAGWTIYRTGDTGNYNFAYTTSYVFSSPNCIYHDYPVGGTQLTADWFVSPVFDFSAGGKVDSLRSMFAGFGMPGASDTLSIVLLKGSQNPASASMKTTLFDFRGSNYQNDQVWRKFSNITVPATTGQCYIAIKYVTVNNWLEVRFDNIAVSASHNGTFTAVSSQQQSDQAARLFPTVIKSNELLNVHSSLPLKEQAQLRIFNLLGALVLEKTLDSEQQQLPVQQPTGTYIYQLIKADGTLLKTGRLVIQ